MTVRTLSKLLYLFDPFNRSQSNRVLKVMMFEAVTFETILKDLFGQLLFTSTIKSRARICSFIQKKKNAENSQYHQYDEVFK